MIHQFGLELRNKMGSEKNKAPEKKILRLYAYLIRNIEYELANKLDNFAFPTTNVHILCEFQ